MATVASVYAKALFALGKEKGQLEKIQEELKEFVDASGSHPALSAVLAGSGINPNDRREILEQVTKAMGVSGIVKRLLDLLVTKGRMPALPEISRELEMLIEESKGIKAGRLRSAIELSAEEISKLESALAKRVGGKVRLVQTVDPSLLGGVVATVGGRTFDASLKSQLERFKSEMI